jgi:hypothetical protein
MTDAAICLCSSEPQANAILQHLRNAGFSSEISVLLQEKAETKNISVKEDASRGAKIGSVVGGVLAALALPGLGAALAVGPILALLGGAAAGGVVGGLAGGSGAFKPLGLPEDVSQRLHARINEGAILIAVHTNDPAERETALRIFRSEEAEEIYDERGEQAA